MGTLQKEKMEVEDFQNALENNKAIKAQLMEGVPRLKELMTANSETQNVMLGDPDFLRMLYKLVHSLQLKARGRVLDVDTTLRDMHQTDLEGESPKCGWHSWEKRFRRYVGVVILF